MTREDFEPFVKALAVCAETLDAPMSELRLRGYFEALKDLELAPVLHAIRHAMRTQTFVPKPAELRVIVEGSLADEAEGAWADVLRAIRKVGRYGDPTLVLPPRTHAAMRCTFGSWSDACDMGTEGPERLGARKAFLAAYAANVRQAHVKALTLAQVAPALQAGIRQALEATR